MGKPTDLVQGTLDLLILRTIEHEPKHGWAIAKRIREISNDVLKVQQGSLYPALYRLEKEGWITGHWAVTETGREAKFYALTSTGRSHLQREVAAWERLSGAIDLVIQQA
ncbi:MAG: PadR family transcriptional regulator [Acidobacteria bacterium]|nr:PadR family transcriptional regulator [Acidobacteriota bacterium]